MRRLWQRSPGNVGRPHFTAIAAMTLDGKIAAHRRQFTDWTSREDKAFLRRFLATQDVVVVGRNTYETAQAALRRRNCIVLTRSVTGAVRQGENLRYCNPRGVPLARLVGELGYRTVAVLGGTQTYTYCLEHGLLDEFYLTVEPLVFGRGLLLFHGRFSLRRPRIISVRRLNSHGSLLIHAAFR